MRIDRGSLYLINVKVNEIRLSTDPLSYPERALDRGVVPWAMVEYLRRIESFPAAPMLSVTEDRFVPIEGGRHLWAASVVGWQEPIQCLLRVPTSGVRQSVAERCQEFSQRVATPVDSELVFRHKTFVLCFSRPASSQEQVGISAEILELATTSKSRGSSHFCEVIDQAWAMEGVVFSWKTPTTGNPEDRALAAEFMEMLRRVDRVLPIAALNGHTLFGV